MPSKLIPTKVVIKKAPEPEFAEKVRAALAAAGVAGAGVSIVESDAGVRVRVIDGETKLDSGWTDRAEALAYVGRVFRKKEPA